MIKSFLNTNINTKMITKEIGENGINIAAIRKEKKEGRNNRDNG